MRTSNYQPFTNNQRFVITLAGMVLAGIGLMKVSPAQQSKPAQQPKAVASAWEPTVVRVHKLIIVDGENKPRAELSCDGDNEIIGGFCLVIKDYKGQQQVELSESGLGLFDSGHGGPMFQFRKTDDDEPDFRITDKQGGIMHRLWVDERGKPQADLPRK